MRNLLRGTICGGGSGRGRGGQDPPANQEDPSLDVHRGSSHQQDPPPRNTSLGVRGGSSDQQHEPLSNPSFLLVFPLPPSQEQPPSPPNFVVLMGLVPLSPHPVAIDIPTPADPPVEQQDQQEEAPQVEETADPPATVEEQDQLPVPLRPVIPDFFRFPGIPGQLQLRDQGSLVATIQYYKNWIRFWHQIVQSLLSLLQYLASFRGVGDGGASTSGMENEWRASLRRAPSPPQTHHCRRCFITSRCYNHRWSPQLRNRTEKGTPLSSSAAAAAWPNGRGWRGWELRQGVPPPLNAATLFCRASPGKQGKKVGEESAIAACEERGMHRPLLHAASSPEVLADISRCQLCLRAVASGEDRSVAYRHRRACECSKSPSP
nr:hypothetical protein Iba_chr10dCG14500 [Ipomoea batatas]